MSPLFRFVHLLVALAATISLAACDRPAPTPPPPTAPSAPAPLPASTPPTTPPTSTPVSTTQITIFAAASTTDAITAAAADFEKATGIHIVTSYGASSTLAKQLEAGAHVDVFLSADEKWMDDLASHDAIDKATRVDLLAGELVLIAPKGQSFTVSFTPEFAFTERLPQIKRLAVADPEHVPAGLYTKQALEKLGWWTSLKPLMLPAADVRAALRLVEMGEADAGFVYATDARASSKIEIIATVPENLHEPVRYPIAVCKGAVLGAQQFVDWLRDPQHAGVFTSHGFTVLPPR